MLGVVGLLAVSVGLLARETAPGGPATADDPSAGLTVEEVLAEHAAVVARSTYRAPSPAALERLERAAALVRAGQVRSAAQAAAEADHEVVELADGSVLVRPRDALGTGGAWWLHRRGVRPVAVQVPHPVDDLDTAGLGVELFDRLGASDLLLAGSSRDEGADGAPDSADVAGLARSSFDTFHASGLASLEVVIQLHGFAAEAHPAVTAEAIVSAGPGRATDLHRAIVRGLRGAGFAACLYPADACSELGGERNVQGASATAVGVPFVHLELSRASRRASGRGAVIDALTGALQPLTPAA